MELEANGQNLKSFEETKDFYKAMLMADVVSAQRSISSMREAIVKKLADRKSVV